MADKLAVVYPFKAEGKHFTAENEKEVADLPKPVLDYFIGTGNVVRTPTTGRSAAPGKDKE